MSEWPVLPRCAPFRGARRELGAISAFSLRGVCNTRPHSALSSWPLSPDLRLKSTVAMAHWQQE